MTALGERRKSSTHS